MSNNCNECARKDVGNKVDATEKRKLDGRVEPWTSFKETKPNKDIGSGDTDKRNNKTNHIKANKHVINLANLHTPATHTKKHSTDAAAQIEVQPLNQTINKQLHLLQQAQISKLVIIKRKKSPSKAIDAKQTLLTSLLTDTRLLPRT